MAEDAAPTDDAYEEHRRQAEQAFLLGYTEWRHELVTQARQYSPMRTRGAPKSLQVQRKAAALKAGEELVQSLARLCSAYGRTELAAYAELVQRSGVAPSRALIRVRDHADETIDESRRKWDSGIDEFSRGFNFGNLPDVAWDSIEQFLRDFSKNAIENELWTGPRGTMEASSPAATTAADRGRTGTDPVAEERKALLFNFKTRARSQGTKVTDKMVAEAANPGKWNDRTMVTWWKRNDPRCQPPHDRKIRAVLAKDPKSLWSHSIGRPKHPPK